MLNTSNDIPENKQNEYEIIPEKTSADADISFNDIFDKETIKAGIKMLFNVIETSVENNKAEIEVKKQKIEERLKLKQLEIEEIKEKQKHLANFDLRNKAYTLLLLVLVFGAIMLLRHFSVLDNSATAAIFVLFLGVILSSNMDLLKNIFKKNKM